MTDYTDYGGITATRTWPRDCAALVPEPRGNARDRTPQARMRELRQYLAGDYVHPLTGSRIRLVDTKAPDAPRKGIAPGTGPDGRTLRYALQCLDHGTGPVFHDTLMEAERAVREPASWCPACVALLEARPGRRAWSRPHALPSPGGQMARSRSAQ